VSELDQLRLDDVAFRREAEDAVQRIVVTIPIGRAARWMERFPLYGPDVVEAMRVRAKGGGPFLACWVFSIDPPDGWKVSDARVAGIETQHAAHIEAPSRPQSASIALATALRDLADGPLTWTIVLRRDGPDAR